VAKLVLRNNTLQSLALSLTEAKGVADVGDEKRLMHALEAANRLDRKVEYLPDDMMLDQLERQGKGLTRPELAVLLAYAKLAFHDDVLASDVPDDPYFAVELRRYFPDGVRVGYPDAVDGHRLRREIIATGLANAVINRTGPSVAVRLAEDTGRPVSDVARAYALTRDAFGVLDINTAIDALDTKIPGKLQMELYGVVQTFTIDRMVWFMRHVDFTPGLAALVERFKAGVRALPTSLTDNPWLAKGVPATLAFQIQRLASLAAVPDAILVAERAGIAPADAVETLDALSLHLALPQLRSAISTVLSADSYERQALMRIADSLDSSLRRLAVEVTSDGRKGAAGVVLWAQLRAAEVGRATRTINEMLAGPLSLAKLSVAAGALTELPKE
jgi:glutamate dehydrogenase